MRKFQSYFLVLLSCIILGSSCKKWMDVQPEDKFTEGQIYGSKQSTYQVLNGIYLSLAKNGLYGSNMTMVVPECLAQQYNISSGSSYYVLSTYNYSDKATKSYIESVWTGAYTAIANINSFVSQLDKYKGVLTPKEDSLVKGEAFGLRAFLHLDMLRMFGPMYNSADSTQLSIPYYRKLSTNYNPYIAANSVMDSIAADIALATTYLASDPVLTFGPKGDQSALADPFFQNRNLRMNFYAVKALEARMNMYRGNKTAAFTAAKYVIDYAQTWFPWVKPASVISNKDNPDRIFSTELLFAAFSLDLYKAYSSVYSASLSDDKILAPLDSRLKTIYEDPTNINDYRYNPNWLFSYTSSKSYRTFYKYADVTPTTTTFRYWVPLMRISEMYYIAAESAPDNTTAFSYLNTVRNNRGLVNLANTATLATEIKKEYQKEFYGEGQLFYYYKRTNATAVPNGSAASGNVTMNKTIYVVPKPDSETNFH